ncbi:MAG: hypothetical protein WED34_12660 [Planctomycetales bacterium]
MSRIVARCECGARFRVAAERAGRRVKCPTCDGTFVIPGAPAEPSRRPGSGPAGGRPTDAGASPSGGTSAAAHRIEVGVAHRGQAPSIPIVRESLVRLLANMGDAIGRVELEIIVTEWTFGSRDVRYLTCGLFGAAQCALTARGRVDGVPVHVDSRHARRFGFWGGDDDDMRLRALQDCLWDVQQAIQQAGPGTVSDAANLWSNVRLARWIVFVLVGAAAAVRNVFFGPEGIGGAAGLVLGLLGGALLGAIGFGAMGMLTLLFMPGDFYRNTVTGVRVLEKSGTRHVWALRLMAGAIGAILLTIFVLFAIPTIRGT